MKTFRTPILCAVFVLSLAPSLIAQNLRIESFQGKDVVAGEVIVRFRGATAVQSQSLTALDADIAASEPVGQTGAVRLRSRGRSTAALLQTYSARADVLYAEPNYVWHKTDIPNDGFFGQQYGLNSSHIDAVTAWNVTEGSRSIVVGVVDTGVDYTHPDLAANIWSAPFAFTVTIGGQTINCPAGTHGFNAINKTCDPMDDEGHGTHVAGIIGAAGNNGLGVSGVSRIVSIMGLKFLDSSGNGSTADAINAIEFAIQVKANPALGGNVRVLNNSWGGGAFSQALLDKINLANTSDMLFVASAGNGDSNGVGVSLDVTPSYPASYGASNIIAVAATDSADGLGSFSNFGAASVHLGAPGVSIASTFLQNRYQLETGTSMAAAMVSGAAALVLSSCTLSTASLKDNLLATGSLDLVLPSGKTITGGRLNVRKALTFCRPSPPPTFTLGVTPGKQVVGVVPGTTAFTATITPVGGFAGSVTLAAFGMPPGMTVGFNPPVIGPGSSTVTLTLNSSVSPGIYLVGITGAFGAMVRTAGVVVNVGPTAMSLGQPLSGALATTDQGSLNRLDTFADFYQITIGTTTNLQIDLQSTEFDGFLYLLRSDGSIVAFNDDVALGNRNARIMANAQPAGTYLIEVTSFDIQETGNYVLSVNAPTISSVRPNVGPRDSAVSVTVTGTRFTSSTVIAVGGGGISVGPVTINGTFASATATATFTIAADAAFGVHDVTVTTAEGTSAAAGFDVAESIGFPQTIVGVLETTDVASPQSSGRYADFYAITIPTNQSIQIDLQPEIFDGFLYLLRPDGSEVHSSPNTTSSIDARIITGILAAGTYLIEATSTISGATGVYRLSINVPTISTIAPNFGAQGSTLGVTIAGTRMALPMTVNAGGCGFTVGNLSITTGSQTSTTATAAFNIGAGAPIGACDVSVTTSEGMSNSVPFVVVPSFPPIALGQTLSGNLTTADPPAPHRTGRRADIYQLTLAGVTSLTLEMRSSVIDPYVYVISSAGVVLFEDDDSGGLGNARISALLQAGTYFIEATTFEPSSTGSYTLSVTPNGPALSSISPTIVPRGFSTVVTLTGTNLLSSMAVNAGSDITIASVNGGGNSATVRLDVGSSAGLGSRDLTVTASSVTSNALTFTVVAPFPDLSLTESHSTAFGVGFNDTYRMNILNRGTLATSGAMTVVQTLPAGFAFVSAIGTNWTCTPSGQSVSCTNPNSLGINSQTFIDYVVAVTAAAAPGVTASATVSVLGVPDLNSANNTASASFVVIPTPAPVITLNPSPLKPGEQATLGISFPGGFPHAFSGTITLGFVSNAAIPFDDPAIQFATGGRQVSFTFAANSTQGRFGANSQVGFQTGTVAGTLTFNGLVQAGTVQASFTPSVSQGSLSVPQQPPTISKVQRDPQSGTISITLYSTMREVTRLSISFAGTKVQLSCGGIAGCIVSGPTLTFDVGAIFTAWYSSDTAFGSLSTLRVPFSIQGSVSGTVSVTLGNSKGTSNISSFSLP